MLDLKTIDHTMETLTDHVAHRRRRGCSSLLVVATYWIQAQKKRSNINRNHLFRSAHPGPNMISMMLRAYLVLGVHLGSRSHGPALVCESLLFPCFYHGVSRVVRCGDGARPPRAISIVLTFYLYFYSLPKRAF